MYTNFPKCEILFMLLVNLTGLRLAIFPSMYALLMTFGNDVVDSSFATGQGGCGFSGGKKVGDCDCDASCNSLIQADGPRAGTSCCWQRVWNDELCECCGTGAFMFVEQCHFCRTTCDDGSYLGPECDGTTASDRNCTACTSQCSSGEYLDMASAPCDGTTVDDRTCVTCRTSCPDGFMVDYSSGDVCANGDGTQDRPCIATEAPTAAPTANPTLDPTAGPTSNPTLDPTAGPTAIPTLSPTAGPTAAPTHEPTAGPTAAPTRDPTAGPTASASKNPTTANPTFNPTTLNPTLNPTSNPTFNPTQNPTSWTTVPLVVKGISGTFSAEENSILQMPFKAFSYEVPLRFELNGPAILAGASVVLQSVHNSSTSGYDGFLTEGAIVWTPQEAHGGLVHNFTLSTTTPGDDTKIVSLQIAVKETNLVPSVSVNGSHIFYVGETNEFTVEAIDWDLPPQQHYFFVDALSQSKGMRMNQSSGVLSWFLPDAEFEGEHELRLSTMEASEPFAVGTMTVKLHLVQPGLSDEEVQALLLPLNVTVQMVVEASKWRVSPRILVKFSEPVTTLLSSKLLVTNAARVDIISATPSDFEVTIAPNSSGIILFSVLEGAVQSVSSGLDSKASSQLSLEYDFQLKAPVITALFQSTNQKPIFVVAFDEPVSWLQSVALGRITNSSSNCRSCTLAPVDRLGKVYEIVVTPLASGNVTLVIPPGVAVDDFGNLNDPSLSLQTPSILYDTDPPVLTLATLPILNPNSSFPVVQISVSVSKPFEFFGAASEAFEADSLEEWLLTRAGNTRQVACSDYGLQLIIELSPRMEGPVAISLPQGFVVDYAGNSNTKSVAHSVDFRCASGMYFKQDSGCTECSENACSECPFDTCSKCSTPNILNMDGKCVTKCPEGESTVGSIEEGYLECIKDPTFGVSNESMVTLSLGDGVSVTIVDAYGEAEGNDVIYRGFTLGTLFAKMRVEDCNATDWCDLRMVGHAPKVAIAPGEEVSAASLITEFTHTIGGDGDNSRRLLSDKERHQSFISFAQKPTVRQLRKLDKACSRAVLATMKILDLAHDDPSALCHLTGMEALRYRLRPWTRPPVITPLDSSFALDIPLGVDIVLGSSYTDEMQVFEHELRSAIAETVDHVRMQDFARHSTAQLASSAARRRLLASSPYGTVTRSETTLVGKRVGSLDATTTYQAVGSTISFLVEVVLDFPPSFLSVSYYHPLGTNFRDVSATQSVLNQLPGSLFVANLTMDCGPFAVSGNFSHTLTFADSPDPGIGVSIDRHYHSTEFNVDVVGFYTPCSEDSEWFFTAPNKTIRNNETVTPVVEFGPYDLQVEPSRTQINISRTGTKDILSGSVGGTSLVPLFSLSEPNYELDWWFPIQSDAHDPFRSKMFMEFKYTNESSSSVAITGLYVFYGIDNPDNMALGFVSLPLSVGDANIPLPPGFPPEAPTGSMPVRLGDIFSTVCEAYFHKASVQQVTGNRYVVGSIQDFDHDLPLPCKLGMKRSTGIVLSGFKFTSKAFGIPIEVEDIELDFRMSENSNIEGYLRGGIIFANNYLARIEVVVDDGVLSHFLLAFSFETDSVKFDSQLRMSYAKEKLLASSDIVRGTASLSLLFLEDHPNITLGIDFYPLVERNRAIGQGQGDTWMTANATVDSLKLLSWLSIAEVKLHLRGYLGEPRDGTASITNKCSDYFTDFTVTDPGEFTNVTALPRFSRSGCFYHRVLPHETDCTTADLLECGFTCVNNTCGHLGSSLPIPLSDCNPPPEPPCLPVLFRNLFFDEVTGKCVEGLHESTTEEEALEMAQLRAARESAAKTGYLEEPADELSLKGCFVPTNWTTRDYSDLPFPSPYDVYDGPKSRVLWDMYFEGSMIADAQWGSTSMSVRAMYRDGKWESLYLDAVIEVGKGDTNIIITATLLHTFSEVTHGTGSVVISLPDWYAELAVQVSVAKKAYALSSGVPLFSFIGTIDTLEFLDGLVTLNDITVSVETYVGLNSADIDSRSTFILLEGEAEVGKFFSGHAKTSLEIEKANGETSYRGSFEASVEYEAYPVRFTGALQFHVPSNDCQENSGSALLEYDDGELQFTTNASFVYIDECFEDYLNATTNATETRLVSPSRFKVEGKIESLDGFDIGFLTLENLYVSFGCEGMKTEGLTCDGMILANSSLFNGTVEIDPVVQFGIVNKSLQYIWVNVPVVVNTKMISVDGYVKVMHGLREDVTRNPTLNPTVNPTTGNPTLHPTACGGDSGLACHHTYGIVTEGDRLRLWREGVQALVLANHYEILEIRESNEEIRNSNAELDSDEDEEEEEDERTIEDLVDLLWDEEDAVEDFDWDDDLDSDVDVYTTGDFLKYLKTLKLGMDTDDLDKLVRGADFDFNDEVPQIAIQDLIKMIEAERQLMDFAENCRLARQGKMYYETFWSIKLSPTIDWKTQYAAFDQVDTNDDRTISTGDLAWLYQQLVYGPGEDWKIDDNWFEDTGLKMGMYAMGIEEGDETPFETVMSDLDQGNHGSYRFTMARFRQICLGNSIEPEDWWVDPTRSPTARPIQVYNVSGEEEPQNPSYAQGRFDISLLLPGLPQIKFEIYGYFNLLTGEFELMGKIELGDALSIPMPFGMPALGFGSGDELEIMATRELINGTLQTNVQFEANGLLGSILEGTVEIPIPIIIDTKYLYMDLAYFIVPKNDECDPYHKGKGLVILRNLGNLHLNIKCTVIKCNDLVTVEGYVNAFTFPLFGLGTLSVKNATFLAEIEESEETKELKAFTLDCLWGDKMKLLVNVQGNSTIEVSVESVPGEKMNIVELFGNLLGLSNFLNFPKAWKETLDEIFTAEDIFLRVFKNLQDDKELMIEGRATVNIASVATNLIVAVVMQNGASPKVGLIVDIPPTDISLPVDGMMKYLGEAYFSWSNTNWPDVEAHLQPSIFAGKELYKGFRLRGKIAKDDETLPEWPTDANVETPTDDERDYFEVEAAFDGKQVTITTFLDWTIRFSDKFGLVKAFASVELPIFALSLSAEFQWDPEPGITISLKGHVKVEATGYVEVGMKATCSAGTWDQPFGLRGLSLHFPFEAEVGFAGSLRHLKLQGGMTVYGTRIVAAFQYTALPPSFAMCAVLENFSVVDMIEAILNKDLGPARPFFNILKIGKMNLKINPGHSDVLFGRQDECNIVPTGLLIDLHHVSAFWDLIQIPRFCLSISKDGGFAIKTQLNKIKLGPLVIGAAASEICPVTVRDPVTCGEDVEYDVTGPSFELSWRPLLNPPFSELKVFVSGSIAVFGLTVDVCTSITPTSLTVNAQLRLGPIRFLCLFSSEFGRGPGTGKKVELLAKMDTTTGETLMQAIVGMIDDRKQKVEEQTQWALAKVQNARDKLNIARQKLKAKQARRKSARQREWDKFNAKLQTLKTAEEQCELVPKEQWRIRRNCFTRVNTKRAGVKIRRNAVNFFQKVGHGIAFVVEQAAVAAADGLLYIAEGFLHIQNKIRQAFLSILKLIVQAIGLIFDIKYFEFYLLFDSNKDVKRKKPKVRFILEAKLLGIDIDLKFEAELTILGILKGLLKMAWGIIKKVFGLDSDKDEEGASRRRLLQEFQEGIEEAAEPVINSLDTGTPVYSVEDNAAEEDEVIGPLQFRPTGGVLSLALLCAQMPLIMRAGYNEVDLQSLGGGAPIQIYEQASCILKVQAEAAEATALNITNATTYASFNLEGLALKYPFPDLALQETDLENLRLALYLEGNQFGGPLYRLSSPSLEVLYVDENRLSGSLMDLNASTNIKILSLQGNRLRDHETFCIGDAFADKPKLEYLNIADNLHNHSRPCNILSPGSTPHQAVQGVVAFETSVLEFCGECGTEDLMGNCAISECIDESKRQEFLEMILNIIRNKNPPSADSKVPTTAPTPNSPVYSRFSPTAPPSDSTTSSPTTLSPTSNPTTALFTGDVPSLELLRLEARGSFSNMTTFATFRFEWPPHRDTSAVELAATIQSKLEEDSSVRFALVHPVCRPGLLGETCRYTTQLNWRNVDKSIQLNPGYHPLLTPKATLQDFMLEEMPSREELIQVSFPTQDVFPTQLCQEECAEDMSEAFVKCLPTILVFDPESIELLTDLCHCLDLIEHAKEFCSLACFDSALAGFKELIIQERWPKAVSGLQSLVTNSTSVASLIKLLKHVQSLPSTCLLHDGVQSFASQRRLLAPVSLGDSIDDLRNDIRYELIDQCDRSSCQFDPVEIVNASYPYVSSMLPMENSSVNATSFITEISILFSKEVTVFSMNVSLGNISIKVPSHAITYMNDSLSRNVTIDLQDASFSAFPSMGGGQMEVVIPAGGVVDINLTPNVQELKPRFHLAPNGPVLNKFHPEQWGPSRHLNLQDKAIFLTFNEAVNGARSLVFSAERAFKAEPSVGSLKYNRGNGKDRLKYFLPLDYWLEYRCSEKSLVMLDATDLDGVVNRETFSLEHETSASCKTMTMEISYNTVMLGSTSTVESGFVSDWIDALKVELLDQLDDPKATTADIYVTSVDARNKAEVSLVFFLATPVLVSNFMSQQLNTSSKLINTRFDPVECYGAEVPTCVNYQQCAGNISESAAYACVGESCGQCYDEPIGCKQEVFPCIRKEVTTNITRSEKATGSMLGDGTDRHEVMTALEILLPIMLPLLAALVVGYLFRHKIRRKLGNLACVKNSRICQWCQTPSKSKVARVEHKKKVAKGNRFSKYLEDRGKPSTDVQPIQDQPLSPRSRKSPRSPRSGRRSPRVAPASLYSPGAEALARSPFAASAVKATLSATPQSKTTLPELAPKRVREAGESHSSDPSAENRGKAANRSARTSSTRSRRWYRGERESGPLADPEPSLSVVDPTSRLSKEEVFAAKMKAEEEAAVEKKAEEEAAVERKAGEEAAVKMKARREAAAKMNAVTRGHTMSPLAYMLKMEAAAKMGEAAAKNKAGEAAVERKAEEEAATEKNAEEGAAVERKAEEEAAVEKKAEDEAAVEKKAEEEAAVKKAAENIPAPKQLAPLEGKEGKGSFDSDSDFLRPRVSKLWGSRSEFNQGLKASRKQDAITAVKAIQVETQQSKVGKERVSRILGLQDDDDLMS